MRYLNLWQTELPPVLPMSGPINGAAHPSQACEVTQDMGNAAAPPEPTQTECYECAVCGRRSNYDPPTGICKECQCVEEPTYVPGVGFLPRHEPTPADPVWVPWSGGECPVHPGALVHVKFRDGDVYMNQHISMPTAWHWDHNAPAVDIVAYALANPTPRGPCVLPKDHVHAELEKLYMSDASLRVWVRRVGSLWHETWENEVLWSVCQEYHVAHVAPEGV